MLILGLLLILFGSLVVLAAVFDLETTSVEMVGLDLNALTVFFLGVAAGLAILWGFGILKFGTRRSLQRRRESKKLTELSEKLDRVEAERRAEGGADEA
jgi:hypothetical protein